MTRTDPPPVTDFTSVRPRSDSGSSTGSAPARKSSKPIRPFSPISDDGNLVANVPDDDTPPPADQPLIRQSLGAFGGATSASTPTPPVPTYAPPPTTVDRRAAPRFLPGQEVAPPPPPPSAPPEKKKRPRKKPKESYAFQTGKFRISQTNPATTSHGGEQVHSGPYGATFRADPKVSPYVPTAQPPSQAVPRMIQGRNHVAQTDSAQNGPPLNGPSFHTSVASHQDHLSMSHSGGGPTSRPAVPASSSIQSFQTPAASSPNLSVATMSRLPGSEERMVTVLIHDSRSGKFPDLQLVELSLPIRQTEKRDGYWADAQELCHLMQSGPGRIDGPAKVSCLRDEFRQIFLRVTEENEDVSERANLFVTKGLELQIFVDPIGPPRASSSRFIANLRGLQEQRDAPRSYGHRSSKRRHSPSDSDSPIDRGPPEVFGHASGEYAGSRRHRKRARHRSPSYPPVSASAPLSYVRDSYGRKRYVYETEDSSCESESEGELQERFRDAVFDILSRDPGYLAYFRANTSGRRAQDMYALYRVVYPLLDKYTGTAALSDKPDYLIRDEHICRCLAIMEEPEKWAKECRETVELMDLYGPQGSRMQDPRVLQALSVTEQPRMHEKPIKRLRRTLREIHADWERQRSHPSPRSTSGG